MVCDNVVSMAIPHGIVLAPLRRRLIERRQVMAQQQAASDERLKAILHAFNAHDLDAIMEFFADDCSFTVGIGVRFSR